MHRRFVVASAIAVVVAAAFLPGSGFGSRASAARGAQEIPAGLAAAIHARLGAGAIRSSSASRAPLVSLGWSVALSADGTTALVGAPDASGTGLAFVFHVSHAGTWSSTSTPTVVLTNRPGHARGQEFGNGVALSADGTTAFVAAPGARNGVIYVFHVSTENAWASASRPTASLTVRNGVIGGYTTVLAVSSDGTTLVAGAPSLGLGGGAYVFHTSRESAWASTSRPTAALSYADESSDDREAGASVAISQDGTTVLVSDTSDYYAGGTAWLYHVSGEDAWKSTGKPTAILSVGNYSPGDGPAGALAFSGDGSVAFVWDPNGDENTGTIEVFRASGEAAWTSTSTPTAILQPPPSPDACCDTFGASVAVSSSGTTAVVTAPTSLSDGGYVFRVSDEGAWTSSSAPQAKLTDASGDVLDELGYASALSADGATALVGAPDARGGNGAGAVDVFHVSHASFWASTSTPAAILRVAPKFIPCEVPLLIGRTVPQAKARLKEGYCRLGNVTRVHSWRVKGHVVSQTPGQRSILPHVGRVDIEISG